jgi:hypothetical protein
MQLQYIKKKVLYLKHELSMPHRDTIVEIVDEHENKEEQKEIEDSILQPQSELEPLLGEEGRK